MLKFSWFLFSQQLMHENYQILYHVKNSLLTCLLSRSLKNSSFVYTNLWYFHPSNDVFNHHYHFDVYNIPAMLNFDEQHPLKFRCYRWTRWTHQFWCEISTFAFQCYIIPLKITPHHAHASEEQKINDYTNNFNAALCSNL